MKHVPEGAAQFSTTKLLKWFSNDKKKNNKTEELHLFYDVFQQSHVVFFFAMNENFHGYVIIFMVYRFMNDSFSFPSNH